MQPADATATNPTLPELLAPAGSLDALYAAVENGADAVYFGLAGPDGFNARNRAENIATDRLGETMDLLRGRHVKGYLTLNTLLRCDELPTVEKLLRQIAEARVDAILVQDFGLARLMQRFCPNIIIHVSTQMSLTSRRGIELAASLGIRRVVLPRELSLEQIQSLCASTDLELECFVHGALCISFSGQCYASLALGGRSANRGRCAQPCRMSYALIDGKTNEQIADTKQLLSPCDLATLTLLDKLVATGVRSLKIEGRLKTPEYVATVVRCYRNALDQIVQASKNDMKTGTDDRDLERLSLTFSRGFATGWLEGVEPRRLVPGNILSHRGTPLGTVVEMRRDAVVVRLSGPVRRGDGILFENEEHPDQSQGGRVYEIFQRRESVQQADAGSKVLLTFANNSIDPEFVLPGQSARKTDDPRLRREIRRSLDIALKSVKDSPSKIPLDLDVRAESGKPIRIFVRISDLKSDETICELAGEEPLEIARKHALSIDVLKEQFSRLGGTKYSLASLQASIVDNPMVPLSVLGQLRRAMIEQLDAKGHLDFDHSVPQQNLVYGDSLETLRNEDQSVVKRMRQQGRRTESATRPVLHLLLRDARWLEDSNLLAEIVRRGCRSFYVELKTVGEYKFAADAIHKHDAEFVAVCPRTIKPGEDRILKQIAKFKPDAVLVRNLEELAFFRNHSEPTPIIADFSFNIINDLGFRQLLDWGAERITPGWDVVRNADLPEERASLEDFLQRISVDKLEMIVIGRMPLFTMEHCLWRGNLIRQGEACNRICRTQSLKIRDRYGALHTVRSDLLCRNIVENSSEYRFENDLSRFGHLRIEWDERLGDATPLETLVKLKRLTHSPRQDD